MHFSKTPLRGRRWLMSKSAQLLRMTQGGVGRAQRRCLAMRGAIPSRAMPIPALTRDGLLPPGIHDASMVELRATFGSSNARRVELHSKLEDFISVVQGFSAFTSLFVDGSFTTDKDVPGDIDAVLTMPRDALSTVLSVPGGVALFDGPAVKHRYEVHLFIKPEPPVPLMVDFFQSLKPEEALLRRVAPDTKRGILRISL